MIPSSCVLGRRRQPPRNPVRRSAERRISSSEPTMNAITPAAMRVAAVQMTSGASVDENLRAAAPLIAAAADDGAELVLLPENFGLMGLHARDKLDAQERDGDGPQQAFLAETARTH